MKYARFLKSVLLTKRAQNRETMMLAMYIAVAYMRTESSIISNCFFGPIRNAVLSNKWSQH